MSEKTIVKKYFEFTPEWSGLHIKYHIAGYFDSRPHLQLYFIWGKLFLYLPWTHYKKIERDLTTKEKRYDKLKKISNTNYTSKKRYKKIVYDECETPSYGFYIHDRSFWLNIGEKVKCYNFPWYVDWYRTSELKKDGTWEHESPGKIKDFWDKNKWGDILFSETHPYKYTTKDNEEQKCVATISVREMEWRWKCFKWTKLTSKIRKDIEIEFSTDIGEKKGSWKGGCTGCSYEMLPGETPLETLKRMETERKF